MEEGGRKTGENRIKIDILRVSFLLPMMKDIISEGV